MFGLKGKKVLVCGANSFIGSNLISKLKEQCHVIGIYHTNTDKLSGDVLNIPVNDIDGLPIDFDFVFILSAYIPGKCPALSDRKKLFDSNVVLADTICRKFKNSRIIYVSSVAVYKTKESPIVENDNEGGLNEYGVSKLWGEKIVEQTPNYAIVRLSSVYGLGMNLATIIPNYIVQGVQKKAIMVFGNGSRKQNYIHINDVVNFLLRSALFGENRLFLATSAASISNYQLAEIIADQTGSEILFTGSDTSVSFIYNNKETVAALQYSASVSIEEGIKEMILWLKGKY